VALKAILENLDSVEPQFHDLYDEKDGKFVLQVEGIEQHPGAAAVKAALDRVRGEKRTLSEKLTAAENKLADIPDDFDAEEWLSLKAEAPDPNDPDKKKPSDEHLQSQKRLFEQRIANMETKHAGEMKAKDGEIAERDGVIEAVLVEDGLTKALVEAGISKEYLKAARAMLKPSVRVVREDDGTRRAVVETDMGEDDVGKFVLNWAQSDEGRVFVAKPTGGDAKGGNGRSLGENPFDPKNPNKTKQQELIVANDAKARQMAQAVGVTPYW
jgi:hypothetical protein